ncbi:MAG: tetratricopeptide repeat protein [Polyangiaceae bacterium]|nr:tetratricopeptide repeat protein [Polyangiaceae bacterium]
MAIANNPNHLKFKETYLWLARLSVGRHASPQVIAQMCRYQERQIARFDNAQQRDLYWHRNLIRARYRFEQRQYVDAIRLAARVERASAHSGAARVVAAYAYCARGQLDAARRLLRSTLTQVPRQEREALRRVLRRLENRYGTPTSTWRNPASQYWQRRGFGRHTR